MSLPKLLRAPVHTPMKSHSPDPGRNLTAVGTEYTPNKGEWEDRSYLLETIPDNPWVTPFVHQSSRGTRVTKAIRDYDNHSDRWEEFKPGELLGILIEMGLYVRRRLLA